MVQGSNVRVMKDLQGFLTVGQRKDIYNSCELWRDRVLIRLLWKTGRRISELLLIKVKDIDFENSNILWTIIKKKDGGYRRWKPIDRFSLDLLRDYILHAGLEQEHFLLHAGNPHRHISRQRAFQIVRRLAKKAGIEKVGDTKPHPHHFRHSFAIDMARKTKSAADIRKVQMLLEHAHMGITEEYLQFDSSDLREMVEDDE